MALILVISAFAARAEPALRILALGDSLTVGYDLPRDQGFTAQLEAALRARGYPAEVINAGVSGDTTAGGLARLDWALADDPDMVILALGGNDELRAINPAQTRANLDAMLEQLQARNLPVLLAGMKAPPNLGREYREAFDSIYPDLARKYAVPLYPFFLQGVATDPELNLKDGIHPNAEGIALIVEGITPYVLRVIDDELQGDKSPQPEKRP